MVRRYTVSTIKYLYKSDQIVTFLCANEKPTHVHFSSHGRRDFIELHTPRCICVSSTAGQLFILEWFENYLFEQVSQFFLQANFFPTDTRTWAFITIQVDGITRPDTASSFLVPLSGHLRATWVFGSIQVNTQLSWQRKALTKVTSG